MRVLLVTTAKPDELGPELLRGLLIGEPARAAAAEVVAELATVPAPADLVPALVALAS